MAVTEPQLSKRLISLRQTRAQFRECLVKPLERANLSRSPLATAAVVWDLPMECAAAGFTVALTQSERGWQITIEHPIDGDTTLEAAGEAKSLLKALFQCVDATERQIETLEAECRHRLNTMNVAA